MDSNQKNEVLVIKNKIQFCSFHIADHLFGVNILDVKEIKDEVSVTKVYHAPKEIRGFVNIRGHVHLVLDLRLMLGFGQKPIDELSRVVLFKQNVGPSFGILVDRIGDMVLVNENKVDGLINNNLSSVNIEYNKSEILKGICKLDNELLLIIETRKLLDAVNNDYVF